MTIITDTQQRGLRYSRRHKSSARPVESGASLPWLTPRSQAWQRLRFSKIGWKSTLSVGLVPPTKSDKEGKDRRGRRGWKGGRKRGGARSDQKERDRIFPNVRAPNLAGKVSDENLKVNQKNRASAARSVFLYQLIFFLFGGHLSGYPMRNFLSIRDNF